MLNKVAKRWVAALRSGEYKQTTYALKNMEGYCCLGVLCDLYAKEDLGEWEKDFKEVDAHLPPIVSKWSGLNYQSGLYFKSNNDSDFTHLTNDNDTLRKTFSEIADIIESEPRGLFI